MEDQDVSLLLLIRKQCGRICAHFCEIQLFGSLDLKKTGCRNDFRRHISISRIFHVVRRTLCYVCGRKNQISELGLKSIHEVPNNEEPVCIVQEVGYILPLRIKSSRSAFTEFDVVRC